MIEFMIGFLLGLSLFGAGVFVYLTINADKVDSIEEEIDAYEAYRDPKTGLYSRRLVKENKSFKGKEGIR